MAHSEDQLALAAEYALGTLDADERAQVESMMAADDTFAAVVLAWDHRLGSLNQMVGSVEPRPEVWDNIRAAIAPAAVAQPEDLPLQIAPESVVAATIAAPEASVPPPPQPAATEDPPLHELFGVDDANVVQLSGRVRRWRSVASVASALAAALLVMLGLQIYRPELLPAGVRPKPRTEVVEVKTPALSAQYVAVLQQGGNSPAFILTVDAATKNFTVRKVGAQPEAGKSFELWLISDQLPQPRSLGVIGGSEFTERPVLSTFDAGTINGATYAVTVEPAGGSPSGAPTSAPIFSGKLIESVPAPK